MNESQQLPILNLRPRPVNGESWPGYLVRLAQANCLRGLADIVRILGGNIVKLVVADPTDVLPRLGISWDPLKQPGYASDRIPRWVYMQLSRQRPGRSVQSRVCPHCLAADAVGHIRAYWDHPVSLVCREHNVLLLDKCRACGEAISHKRARIARCDCGASFLQQETSPSPTWTRKFTRVFSAAYTDYDNVTFARSCPQSHLAAFVAYQIGTGWYLGDWYRHVPQTFLTQEFAHRVGRLLEDWPSGPADMFQGDMFPPGSAIHKRLNRILCVAEFPAMEEVTNFLLRRQSKPIRESVPA